MSDDFRQKESDFNAWENAHREAYMEKTCTNIEEEIQAFLMEMRGENDGVLPQAEAWRVTTIPP